MWQCTASTDEAVESFAVFFFWQCVRPDYCNRSQESLIHRGLSGKEKLLEQSPLLEPVVKSSDQSTLSPWTSWGLGFYNGLGALRRRGRDREREWEEETEGEREISQRCGDCDRDSQGLLWQKIPQLTNTYKLAYIGVFIELRYTAGGTHKWFRITPSHTYRLRISTYVCLYDADAFV